MFSPDRKAALGLWDCLGRRRCTEPLSGARDSHRSQMKTELGGKNLRATFGLIFGLIELRVLLIEDRI